MSWFRPGSSGSGRSEESIMSAASSSSQSSHDLSERAQSGYQQNAGGHASMTSTPRVFHKSYGSTQTGTPSPQASPIARRRFQIETDPDTCLEVFKTHWNQAKAIMSKSGGSSYGRRTVHEDTEAVIRYVDQMILLFVEEHAVDGGQGPILEYLLVEDILDRLLVWCTQNTEHSDQLKLHLLKIFDLLITQSQQQVVLHKPVIRPLLKLLAMCKEHSNPDIEHFLVIILHQLCVCIMQYEHLLELLFDVSPDHGPAKFLVFSLLIPYIHREGDIGQQARDALLLIMSLSSVQQSVGQYIANNSDFCPVLATGLSGLYSSLPRKLDYPSDDWHQLTTEDIMHTPDLIMFLNSLDFCNAVVQVAHPLVQEQLLLYIYNGFLLPVLGPALHQNEIMYPESEDDLLFFTDDIDDLTSMEEVIAATAYLDLFLRRITEPALMQIFLKFILTAQHDDVSIIDSLITRINSNSRLCMVTLSLFRTLIDLNCEDLMFQLIFKYLIPCNHVMVSQRRAVKDVDMYSKTAEKLLSLRPACCQVDSDTKDCSHHYTADNRSLHSSRSSSPDVTDSSSASHYTPGGSRVAADWENGLPQSEQFYRSYMEYLRVVRVQIEQCSKACQCWSLPYDGENPPCDSLVKTHSSIQPTHDKCSADDACHTGTVFNSSDSDTGEIASSKNDSSLDSNRLENDCDNEPSNASSTPCPVPEDAKGQTLRKSDSAVYANSEADSALSANSGNQTKCDSHISRGQDSPLSDNFSNTEFSAFMMSLKRVQTPVELSCSIEESFTEIESVASRLKFMKTDSKPHSEMSYPMPEPFGTLSSSPPQQCPSSNQIKESKPLTNGSSPGSTTQSHMSSVAKETEASSRSQTSKPISSGSLNLVKRSDATAPTVGPFLTTLLTRLEMMMQNTLYVNLLLTGVVTRLACYPQPLLRSFLLNHTLVFQPTVKSLIQVLGSVKQKVDCFALTVKNFDDMLQKAKQFLLWREEVYLSSSADLASRKDSIASFPGALMQGKSSGTESFREKKNSIKELFRRNSNAKKLRHESRLQLLSDRKGFRYVNQRLPSGSTSQNDISDQLEALKTKNAVYCAIVLDEVLKELAAISQEHAVLCL